MKKRRTLILTLSAILLIIGMIVVLFVRALQKEQSNHALIAAVEAGDTDKALTALNAGADANATEYDETEPAMRDMLKRLWDRLRHPDSEQEPEFHRTALLMLLSEQFTQGPDNKDEAAHAWESAKRSTRTDHADERFWFMEGSGIENFPLLKLLVERGADVNVRDEYYDTPLLLTARWDHRASLLFLIQHGADVMAKDRAGYTALDWAVLNGNLEAIQALLLKGVEVNARDRHGKTTLDHNKTWHYGQRQYMAGYFAAEKELPPDKRKITQAQYDAILDQDRKTEKQIEQMLNKAGAKTSAELSPQAGLKRERDKEENQEN